MGETRGLSARAHLLPIAHIQFGHSAGHVGLCHNSTGYEPASVTLCPVVSSLTENYMSMCISFLTF